MIIRNKKNNTVITNAKNRSGCFHGDHYYIRDGNNFRIPLSIAEQISERLYTEEEYQAGIDVAVEDCEKIIAELEEVNNELSQSEYEAGGYLHDANKRIAELESAQQPVTVSQEVADAIVWFEENLHCWEGEFLKCDIYHDEEFKPKLPESVHKTIGNSTYELRREILKRGYTVKLDPLIENLRAIIQNHMDTKVDMDTLIIEMAEYVKDNYEAK